MRKWSRALMVAMLAVAVSSCAGAYDQTYVRASAGRYGPGSSVSVSYFYDEMAPYGQWIDYGSYGWCWTPYDVDPDWRPYSAGQWVYTDFGWTWASTEPWGWATYHYGRWTFDPAYGWIWVPGTTWAPAYVVWYGNDDCIGWAPMSPAMDFSVSLQFSDVQQIPAQEWCFVDRRNFLAPNLRTTLISIARNRTQIERGSQRGPFVGSIDRIKKGPDAGDVQTWTGRRVTQQQVVNVESPSRGRGQSMGRGSVGFFRPSIRETDLKQAPPPSPEQREVVIPDATLKAEQELERRRLEQSLSNERARLQRDQQNEQRRVPPGATPDEVRARHAAEQQAFEAHAAEQRQVLEQRFQKRIAKPGRGNAVRPNINNDNSGQNQDQNKGNGKKKGERGGGQ